MAATLLVALTISMGCSARNRPTGAAGRGEALVTDAVPQAVYSALGSGTVLVYTAGTARVDRPIELVDMRPRRMTDGIEILATRVNFIGSTPGRTSVSGYPGDFCTTWPVKGFGPTYDVEGLRLRRGDRVAVSFFARPTRKIAGRGPLEAVFDGDEDDLRAAADGAVRGLVARYKQGGALMRQEFGMVDAFLFLREDPNELPPSACSPDAPSIFTGHPNSGERFGVATPGPVRSPESKASPSP